MGGTEQIVNAVSENEQLNPLFSVIYLKVEAL